MTFYGAFPGLTVVWGSVVVVMVLAVELFESRILKNRITADYLKYIGHINELI